MFVDGFGDDLMIIEPPVVEEIDLGAELDQLFPEVNNAQIEGSENFWYEKLSNKNKKLHREMKELRRKYNKSEIENAMREQQLAKTMEDLRNSKKEVENLKNHISVLEQKKSQLELQVCQLENINLEYKRCKEQIEKDKEIYPEMMKKIRRLKIYNAKFKARIKSFKDAPGLALCSEDKSNKPKKGDINKGCQNYTYQAPVVSSSVKSPDLVPLSPILIEDNSFIDSKELLNAPPKRCSDGVENKRKCCKLETNASNSVPEKHLDDTFVDNSALEKISLVEPVSPIIIDDDTHKSPKSPHKISSIKKESKKKSHVGNVKISGYNSSAEKHFDYNFVNDGILRKIPFVKESSSPNTIEGGTKLSSKAPFINYCKDIEKKNCYKREVKAFASHSVTEKLLDDTFVDDSIIRKISIVKEPDKLETKSEVDCCSINNSQLNDNLSNLGNQIKDSLTESIKVPTINSRNNIPESKTLHSSSQSAANLKKEIQTISNFSTIEDSNILDSKVECLKFLSEIKRQFHLPDDNFAPLSPISSPCKKGKSNDCMKLKLGKAKESLDFNSSRNLDSNVCKNDSFLDNEKKIISKSKLNTNNAAVKNPETSTKNDFSYKKYNSIPNSLCIKKKKWNKSTSKGIPYKYSSSKLKLTDSTDFVCDDSSLVTNANGKDIACNVKLPNTLSSSNASALLSGLNLQNSELCTDINSQDANDNSLPSFGTLEATSHCASKTGDSSRKSINSFETVVQDYNDCIAQIRKEKCSKKTRKKNLKKFRNPTSKEPLTKPKENETNPVEEGLKNVNSSLSKDVWCKQAEQTLINIFINPKYIPDKTNLLFYLFQYVYTSSVFSEGSVLDFFLHCDEECIVSSLCSVEEKKKPYLSGLLVSAVETLYSLIVSKESVEIKVICAYCRIFTEICKRKNLVRKPILLAIDLLKTKHKCAAMIIACAVGVWGEPFEVTENMADEVKILHSSIALGVSKKPKRCPLWEPACEFLKQRYCLVPDEEVVKEVVEYLIARINMECVNGSTEDIDQLINPLIILAAHSNWDWTEDHILNKHIIPNLSRYGKQDLNEEAFSVFCNIYGEIFSYKPHKPLDTQLQEFYRGGKNLKDQKFISDCVAEAHIRLLVLQNKVIPNNLHDWFQENIQNPKTKYLASWIKKKTFKSTSKELIREEIVL